jgi:hypothetical protein
MTFVAFPAALDELRSHDFSRLCTAVKEVTFVPTNHLWATEFPPDILVVPSKKTPFSVTAEAIKELFDSLEFACVWTQVLVQLKEVRRFPLQEDPVKTGRYKKYMSPRVPVLPVVPPTVWAELFQAMAQAITGAGIRPECIGLGCIGGFSGFPSMGKNPALKTMDLTGVTELQFGSGHYVHMYPMIEETAARLVSLYMENVDNYLQWLPNSLMSLPTLPRLKKFSLKFARVDMSRFADWYLSLTSLEELTLESVSIPHGREHERVWAYLCRALRNHDNAVLVRLQNLFPYPNIFADDLEEEIYSGRTPGVELRHQKQEFWDRLDEWLDERGSWDHNAFDICCENMWYVPPEIPEVE